MFVKVFMYYFCILYEETSRNECAAPMKDSFLSLPRKDLSESISSEITDSFSHHWKLRR